MEKSGKNPLNPSNGTIKISLNFVDKERKTHQHQQGKRMSGGTKKNIPLLSKPFLTGAND